MSVDADAATLLADRAEGGIRPGLDATRSCLDALGRPDESFASVVVAGTNGKGTCAALLSSVVHAAGYRVGLSTSPELEELRERVRIDGEAIAGARLAELLDTIFETASAVGVRPTAFEALTLAALLHFARSDIDVAVLEVGMGGRLDAVNVVEPKVSVVTQVAVEHTRWLGATVAEIAGEKAAVARAGRPFVTSLVDRRGGREVERAALALGAEVRALGREALLEVSEDRGLAGQRLAVETAAAGYRLVTTLAGVHQARNVALTVLAAETLAEIGAPRIDRAAIEAGVERCRWPGRLEEVVRRGGGTVVLDAAHNPAAVAALRDFLAAHLPEHDLLFGCLDDKDAKGMLVPLAAHASRILLTEPPTAPSSRGARAVASLREAISAVRESADVTVEPRLGPALDLALDSTGGSGGRPLVVTGSVALVGAVRRRLRERYDVPPPATAPIF